MPREHQGEERSKAQLEVDLYVCPEPSCRLIGKRPISDIGGKISGFCRGPLEHPHKKRRMVKVRFVEAP